MKAKRRRASEVPPKVRVFIKGVVSVPFESIEVPLKNFQWEYEKGDFYHWVDLFNHFDSFFEKYVKPRKDLQLNDNFLEDNTPFPREAVLHVLRVTRIILENCTNKHFYSSYEQHLSSLLASTDADIILASLQTLAAFIKKPMGKCLIHDAALCTKLFALSQGWGGKEAGLGLMTCSTENDCKLAAYQVGCTLHFEFYGTQSVPKEDTGNEESRALGLQVIHLPDLISRRESDLQLLKHLVDQYMVPPHIRFSLLTRLRFAKAFPCWATRRQYVCICLYAFTVLVQASNDADDLSTFFVNEPEFVNELVTLLFYEDIVPEDIRILAILALSALYQDRSHQPTILNALTSGAHYVILPNLTQKAIDSITSESSSYSIPFVEALLTLVTVLVSSSSGCSALRETGFIPTLLPLLKDSNPQHMHLVATAVHVLEAFMDYSNPAATLFRDLGGLDDTIARLKLEVGFIDKGPRKHAAESQFHCKNKSSVNTAGESEAIQEVHSETLVAYHRRLLMKALLRAISLGIYAPGSASRLYSSEESMLPSCLCTIFRRAKDFGGGVFSLAATVMSDLIHKDPACFSAFDSAGLTSAFLDAIMGGELSSAEAVTCIPQCLDALCLNHLGLQAVQDRNVLGCFVKIFTSRTYLRALTGDAPGSLSTGLDELMRHAAALRGPGVDMLIEILHTIAKIGCGTEPSAFIQDSTSSAAFVPMETDLEERMAVSVSKGELSKEDTLEQKLGASADNSYSNVEAFLPECISNAGRLLENVLQNADTCRVFIEKRGIQAVLQLFNLPLLPLSFPSGQSIYVAFKNFSSQHSSALTQAVCSSLKEKVKLTIELLESLNGSKLADVEGPNQMKILRCLSGLEGFLSFSTFLLQSTSTMMPELGFAEADILKDMGKSYKEILWQASLISDENIDAQREVEQGLNTAANPVSNIGGRESDDDRSIISVVRHVNPVSLRSGSVSHWGVEPEYQSTIHPGGLHHHDPRDHEPGGQTRVHLGQHADSSQFDIEYSMNAAEMSQTQEPKPKSLGRLHHKIIHKLAFAVRSFLVTLVKGLGVSNHHGADTGSLNGVAKTLAAALARLFYYNLTFNGHRDLLDPESLLSVKCRYLGKVVDDMAVVIFDSRRRVCNTALVNNFYAYGTIKELLITFEATSQLLWTLPRSSPLVMGSECGKLRENDKLEHSSWLLETLQRYCRILEYLVSSSLLLSPPAAPHLLVQPIAGGSFSVPRDLEVFIRTLQAQVLDAVLPVWNHSMFSHCSPALITSIVSIITCISSGIGDVKIRRQGVPGNTSQHFMAPPDESAICRIVEMGFSRARAEEALRHVETNSVEMAMEWLFSHPEEPGQEDDEISRALALSLNYSGEACRDDVGDKVREQTTEIKVTEAPPVEDILATCMKLLQGTDAIVFPLTDLIVTLCNQNKGQHRHRVVCYLIQQLKLSEVEGSQKDTSLLCTISHILALVLVEDSSAREIAAENGIVSITLDMLMSFNLRNATEEKVPVPKWVIALLLILDHMLDRKPRISPDAQSTAGTCSTSNVDASEDTTLAGTVSANDGRITDLDDNREGNNSFVGVLGRPLGYMTTDEHHRASNIACNFLQHQVPATTLQAVLQLCARLTKSHTMAMQFLERGGLTALFSLPRSCFFPGFDIVAATIICHLLEDPQTLRIAMKLEIRQTLTSILNRHGGHVSPQTFLTSMAPIISRDPAIFLQAATSVCRLEILGESRNIVLSKEMEKGKEKEKEKEKHREKTKVVSQPEASLRSDDHMQVDDGLVRIKDVSRKCRKGHKKVPHSFILVIDQLLEVILQYPPQSKQEHIGSTVPMEVGEPSPKENGKSKVDESEKSENESLSESSAALAKVTFVLKLMSDILLMYVHAVGVVIWRDSEISRGHGSSKLRANEGLLFHVLHRLLWTDGKVNENNSGEWREKLSEKASWFLVVICGRSVEGRRRVIDEIVRALLTSSSADKKSVKPPNRKVLAFVGLVNSILSKNLSSGNAPAPGCSLDMAKTMIDVGMVQALTGILQVIDLDHPEAPKLAELILKALEALTRASNTVKQVDVPGGSNKKRPSAADERTQDQTYSTFTGEQVTAERAQSAQHAEQQVAGLVQTEAHLAEVTSDSPRGREGNLSENVEHEMAIETCEIAQVHPAPDCEVEFMHDEVEEAANRHHSTAVEMGFQVENRADDDMGNEDDENMGDDGNDDVQEDDGDEDEDRIGEEGATHVSLADTDIEDHENNILGNEYRDDLLEEEGGDFHENRVIEVRWREGLDGLNHLQVLGHPGVQGNLVNTSGEPFQGVNVDDIFGLRRPVGIDRHPQTSYRPFIERSGLHHGGAFQHPLLSRPVQSSEPSGPVWAATRSTFRDAEVASVGSLDATNFYAFDAPILPPEHAGDIPFGDHSDFSMDPMYLTGRRGPGDGRWSDDGQPQAVAQAVAIAHAIEEQFISQLCSLTQVDGHPELGLAENTNHREGIQQTTLPLVDTEDQTILTGNNISEQQNRECQRREAEPAVSQENANVEGDAAGFMESMVQSRVDVDITISEEGSEPAIQDLDSGCQGSIATIGGTLCNLGIETRSADEHLETEYQPVTQRLEVPSATQDLESACQDSMENGANMRADLHSMGVETVSSYGHLGTEGHPIMSTEATCVGVSDPAFGETNMERVSNVDEAMEGTGLGNEAEETSAGPNQLTNEAPSQQQVGLFQGERVDRSNGVSSVNTIDPAFLEALPEDLRAEVLASQDAQSVQAANSAPPPAEGIDPEFLAALPPDIQAEVLEQQRAQIVVQNQQAGQPVDMDNASIIATFPADLREEVLLTSSEEVLAALPSPLLAEAQMLRDRAMSHYQADGLFGVGHRLEGRQNNMAGRGQIGMDRGMNGSVGLTLGHRLVSPLANTVQEVEGKPLVDAVALKAVLQLLRLAQPLGKGLLQRLLLNLCAQSVTRATLVQLLLDMISPEAGVLVANLNEATSQRLYGCQWNVVYAHSQLSYGLPPLVSRRVLEILTYLATNHLSVANLLFYMEPCPTVKLSSGISSELKDKGKEKVVDELGSLHSSKRAHSGQIPMISFLRLLNQSHFLQSSAHLEQVMNLLDVVINSIGLEDEFHSQSGLGRDGFKTQEDIPVIEGIHEIGSNTAVNAQTHETASAVPEIANHQSAKVTKRSDDSEASTSSDNKAMTAYDVLLCLPQPELQNLCKLLAQEGLSDKVYSLAEEVMKKLAIIGSHRKFFISELAASARGLRDAADSELVTLGNTEMLGLSAGSMAGVAILRVLRALATLTSGSADGIDKNQENEREQEGLAIIRELNTSLESLWQGLSVCITKIETKLENNSNFSSTTSSRNAEPDVVRGITSVSPPLPPCAQRLVPFIEAFFVLCKKLQSEPTLVQQDSCDVTAREIKEAAGCSSVLSVRSYVTQQKRAEGGMPFVRFVDKHRRLLNVFVRQNPGLLEKSFSLMLRASRFIDFDNKRAYFCSRIRHQHERLPLAPLRISVRRAYVLEDSYNQLRMRSSQDIKGRLTVQFQGEEGIDAGGLTREWYQLLSRVIFDKGALLFTTVGNESTFQPNPNSVYQTEHLSYFKFVGRVVAKALFDGQLLDVHFTRSFYKHILRVKVTYHDIEAVDPDYYKNLKWLLENDVPDSFDLTFSIDADEEKHILYEKTEVTDYELIPGGRNTRVTDENKHEYVDLVAEHRLTTAIRTQINAFMDGFNELVPWELISIFNDKELELLISGLPEIDLDDLKANTEYTGYTNASPVVQWFWEVVQGFSKEDMARLLQFITGTSKVPLEGFKALQGISGPQKFQIHKAYGPTERLPSAHTCFNQLDLPDYSCREQLQKRLLLAIHEASEGFGFG